MSWCGLPCLCEHVTAADNEMLVCLGRLCTLLASSKQQRNCFIQRLKTLHPDQTFLQTLCSYLSGKTAESADIAIIVSGYKAAISDRSLLASLTYQLTTDNSSDTPWQDEALPLPTVEKCPPEWAIYPPPTLWSLAPRPCITVDESGQLALYVYKPKSQCREITLHCPTHNPAERDVKLDELIKVTHDLEMPDILEREVDEVVVICVDTSLSMNQDCSRNSAATDKAPFTGVETSITEDQVQSCLKSVRSRVLELDYECHQIWMCTLVLSLYYPSHNHDILQELAKTYVRKIHVEEETYPSSFYCPISQDVMSDPVLLVEDGQTYERSSITKWLKKKAVSPVTNLPLTKRVKLVSNRALKTAIEEKLRVVAPSRKKLKQEEESETEDTVWFELTSDDPWQSTEMPKSATVLDLYLRLYCESSDAASSLFTIFYNLYDSDGISFGSSITKHHLALKLGIFYDSVMQKKSLLIRPRTPKAPKGSDNDAFTRLDLAKAMFHSYMYRSMAYDLPHAYGLIQFGDDVDVLSPCVQSVELFLESLARLSAEGETRLTDAILAAGHLVKSYKGKRSERCVGRIIVLTDGEDTKSDSDVPDVARLLHSDKMVLDVIRFGVKGAHPYPGYVYNVSTRERAVQLSEAEPFLMHRLRAPQGWHDTPRMRSTVYQSQRTRQLSLSEMRLLNRALKSVQKHPGYKVKLVQGDMCHWKVRFYGPEGTPYQGGVFKMSLFIEDNFPNEPPRCRFHPPVVPHCNINSYGRVCHSILDRNWTNSTPLKLVLDCIYGLFLTPEPDDPLDSMLAALMFTDKKEYERRIQDWFCNQ